MRTYGKDELFSEEKKNRFVTVPDLNIWYTYTNKSAKSLHTCDNISELPSNNWHYVVLDDFGAPTAWWD